MADFDVQPVGLTAPPQAAYLQTYRPAVAVRNNGIHPADVTGLLRIYDATTGLLIFTTDLHVLAIQPGDTRDALGATHWTLEAIGDYQVIATVTTENDQVPGNDNLSPVTIHVSEEPPPPPPPVEPHAPQHESGGADEVSVDGLRGILADGQPIQPHAANHMTDGTDQISVEGLAGELADDQKPKTHANEAHDPPFVTAIALTEHNASQTAHDASENLEHVAAKGQADGYPELDDGGKVPPDQLGANPTLETFLRVDQTWATPATLGHGADKHDGTVEATANKGQADGYAPLDDTAKVPVINLPAVPPTEHGADKHDATVEATANKAVADGYAPLDAGARVPVDNLPPMDPLEHNWTHENGGVDRINVTDLPGVLDEAQKTARPLAAHALDHQVGADDELNVTGLNGELTDDQPAKAHGADKHDGTVEATANKGFADGYAPLDVTAKVPVANLPSMPPEAHGADKHDGTVEATANKGFADGYAPLDVTAKVPVANLPSIPPEVHGADKHDSTVEATANKGVADGYASLDAGAKVPLGQLPPLGPAQGLEATSYPVSTTDPDVLQILAHVITANTLSAHSALRVSGCGRFDSTDSSLLHIGIGHGPPSAPQAWLDRVSANFTTAADKMFTFNILICCEKAGSNGTLQVSGNIIFGTGDNAMHCIGLAVPWNTLVDWQIDLHVQCETVGTMELVITTAVMELVKF